MSTSQPHVVTSSFQSMSASPAVPGSSRGRVALDSSPPPSSLDDLKCASVAVGRHWTAAAVHTSVAWNIVTRGVSYRKSERKRCDVLLFIKKAFTEDAIRALRRAGGLSNRRRAAIHKKLIPQTNWICSPKIRVNTPASCKRDGFLCSSILDCTAGPARAAA